MTPSTKRVSHRGVITERCGCLQSAVSSILNAKLTGRKNLGRKRCTSNRDDRKLENTVSKADSNTCESFTRSGLTGVSASRVTTLRRLQEKGYQATSEPETTSEASYPGYGEKYLDCAQWSKVLFSDESKFCIHLEIKVPESGGRVERHRIMLLEVQCEFPQSVMIGLPCHLLVFGPLCFLKSTVNAAIYQEIFRALHAAFC